MNAMPPGRVAHYLQMRSAAIQYLRMLEDELVSMEGIRDHVLTDESASDTLRTSE